MPEPHRFVALAYDEQSCALWQYGNKFPMSAGERLAKLKALLDKREKIKQNEGRVKQQTQGGASTHEFGIKWKSINWDAVLDDKASAPYYYMRSGIIRKVAGNHESEHLRALTWDVCCCAGFAGAVRGRPPAANARHQDSRRRHRYHKKTPGSGHVGDEVHRLEQCEFAVQQRSATTEPTCLRRHLG
jgi:hypothetical protein